MDQNRKYQGYATPNFSNGYRSDEELYVYDQCCQNCRYYCDWDEDEYNGCKNYGRPDYKQYEDTDWCVDWKGKRGRR